MWCRNLAWGLKNSWFKELLIHRWPFWEFGRHGRENYAAVTLLFMFSTSPLFLVPMPSSVSRDACRASITPTMARLENCPNGRVERYNWKWQRGLNGGRCLKWALYAVKYCRIEARQASEGHCTQRLLSTSGLQDNGRLRKPGRQCTDKQERRLIMEITVPPLLPWQGLIEEMWDTF